MRLVDQFRRLFSSGPAPETVAAPEVDPAPEMPSPPVDLTQQRVDRFKKGADWQHGALSKRIYPSYEAYVSHQVSKLDTMRDRLELVADETISAFRKRFELLNLKAPASVLCLGARLGHEVMAFIELGHFAVGIDLYPGEENQYVVVGDFHKLVFADGSVDCVYINSLDHILDLEAFTREVRRVLKPGGAFVADIVYGYEEGFWAGEFEVLHWPTARQFADELAIIGKFEMTSERDLTEHGSALWKQYVFAKARPA